MLVAVLGIDISIAWTHSHSQPFVTQMYNNHTHARPQPHVAIPQGSQRRGNPNSVPFSPYAFELTPPVEITNPWEDDPVTPRATESPHRHRSRTTSAYQPDTASIPFPEPQIFRSSSHRSHLEPFRPLRHRSSKSDQGSSIGLHRDGSVSSLGSSGSSYSPPGDIAEVRVHR
jgi:RHO1 GDP-GTP exchange protein 1/2